MINFKETCYANQVKVLPANIIFVFKSTHNISYLAHKIQQPRVIRNVNLKTNGFHIVVQKHLKYKRHTQDRDMCSNT